MALAAGRGGTVARWTLAGTATVSESAERGRGNTEDKRGSRDEPAPKVAEAPAVAGASADQRMGLGGLGGGLRMLGGGGAASEGELAAHGRAAGTQGGGGGKRAASDSSKETEACKAVPSVG